MSAPEPRDLPRRSDFGSGVYRRRIVVEASGNTLRGELEDDFHHFRTTLEHDGVRITRARGEAIRMPWTTCPAGAAQVASLAGAPLSTSLVAVAKYTDPRLQCTHTFDPASLAVALAARLELDPNASPTRRYAVDIPDRRAGRTRAELRRDGEPIFAWELDGHTIRSSDAFDGRSLSGGSFAKWCEEHLSADEAEAAQVMRRACIISIGRIYAFDELPNARIFENASRGACHTFQPGVIEKADRRTGSIRDNSDRAAEFHARRFEDD